MRIKSDKPAHNGGWWHQIKDMPKKVEYHKQIKPQRPVNLKRTWESWSSMTDDDDIKTCALRLGVSSESLSDLGMAWAWQYGAWAFPMRDGAGGVVGIRLRGETGKKWAVAGSRQGVFMPTAWPESTQVALICEGPTDTAAALSIGFKAIGRPSCLGCEAMVAETCRRFSVRRLVIVSDNDGPGRQGAQKLADSLKLPWKIIVPPAKDMRAWVQAGATKDLVECVINQKLWRVP